MGRIVNFKKSILDMVGDEPIEKIVIGYRGWGDRGDSNEDATGLAIMPFIGKVLDWEQAAPLLDYEFSAGYGGIECNAIWAWTPSRVLFIGTYDGSTWIDGVPRNPPDNDLGTVETNLPYCVGGG